MTPTTRDLRLRYVKESGKIITIADEDSFYTNWLEQNTGKLVELLEQCYTDIAWAIGMEDGLDGGQGQETMDRIEALIGETNQIRNIKNAPCPDDSQPPLKEQTQQKQ